MLRESWNEQIKGVFRAELLIHSPGCNQEEISQLWQMSLTPKTKSLN